MYNFKSLPLIIIIFALVFISVPQQSHSMEQTPSTNIVKRAPFHYLFFQQINAMCTIAPMLNRHRLQEIKRLDNNTTQSVYEQAFNDPMLALTRQQWFGESHQYLFAWRKFLADFMRSSAGNNYLTAAANNGLVAPHFYSKDGTWLCKDGAENSPQYPYFLAELNVEHNMDANSGFKIPLVSIKDMQEHPFNSQTDETAGWLAYNKDTKVFEPCTYTKLQNNPIFSSIKMSMLPYNASGQEDVTLNISYATFDCVGFKTLMCPHKDWETGFNGKMPYLLGFLKLMFLALGVNNRNEIIGTDDPVEQAASTEMRRLIQADATHNPWSNEYFRHEFFIQYAIAEIFKNNPALQKKAAKTVDIAHRKYWPTYEDIVVTGKLELCKNANKDPYTRELIAKYLPGPEQTLAYFITEILRHLWYGAASKNSIAFYKSLGLTGIKPLKLWWMSMTFAQIKNAANKKIKGDSFLDMWAELRTELINRYPDIIDWVSFDGHGWVISFDQDLLNKQQAVAKAKSCDHKFLDKLGFAGIESWWGSELETFYKK